MTTSAPIPGPGLASNLGRQQKRCFVKETRDERSESDTRKRILVLFLVCAVFVGGAFAIAALTWKDDVSRELITGLALTGMVVATIIFLPRQGGTAVIAAFALVAGILAFAGTSGSVEGVLPDGPAPQGAVVACPGPGEGFKFKAPAFDEENENGYVTVRESARTSEDNEAARYQLPCELGFSGYCIGEVTTDLKFGTPDALWFILESEEGVIASSTINMPETPDHLPVSVCDGQSDPPTEPTLTAPRRRQLTGPVEFAAAAPGAPMVGFSVYYEDVPDEPHSARWHALDIDEKVGDGIQADFDSRSVPLGRDDGAGIAVAVVPCLALEFPHDTQAIGYFTVGADSSPRTISAPRSSHDQARAQACLNEDR
jgi:hypothetical protein